MNGQTLQNAFVPLPGGGAAVYTASGLSYYRHSDWLGSSRLASTPTRTVYSTTAYAPFGEPYAQSGTADLSFTGQNQDTVGGSYDFLFREYATQGRWPSPDPAGLDAADPSNPQSLNRYAYVLNNPLALIDPLGLTNDCGGPCTPFAEDMGGGCYLITTYDTSGPYDMPQQNIWCVDNSPKHSDYPTLQRVRRGGGHSSPSPAWAAIKAFFTLPSTAPGSCLAVFTDAIKQPLQLAGTTAKTIQQNVAGVQGGAIALTQWAGSLDANAMTTSILNADAETVTAVLSANAVVSIGIANASRAVAAAAPKAPVAFVGAADVILFYGLYKEISAAANGQCHP